MSALLTLLEHWQALFGALGLLAAGFFRYRANKALDRARSAEADAAVHEEMRDHERNASQLSDADLADRLSRRP